jgi:hypothetical protein
VDTEVYLQRVGVREVSQKWAANGAISAVLVRIAYQFVALQMEIFSQYRERRERCSIARVLEVKKGFRLSQREAKFSSPTIFVGLVEWADRIITE